MCNTGSDYFRGYQDNLQGNAYGTNLLTDEDEYKRGWDARNKIEEKLSNMWRD